MPASQSNVFSGPAGLTLKAWAHVKSDGTLVKGFNVSSTSRGAAGTYTVNFTTAMTTANFIADLKAYTQQSTYLFIQRVGIKTVNSVGVLFQDYQLGGEDVDFHIAIYE